MVGAATLRHLAAAGQRCVGIGPGEPVDWAAHTGVFASHYDSGRITRRLDKRREWAVLAGRAIAEYGVIETRSGIGFHHPVGVLIAEVDADRLASTVTVADELGVEFHRYEPGEPIGDDRVTVPAAATVLREPSPGGFIDPRRMLAAQLVVAGHLGAELIGEQVVGVEPIGGGWAVRTVDGSAIEARQIVVAAGPHADEVIGVPCALIEVVAETVVMAQLSASERQRLAGLPSIIVDDLASDHLYVVPPTEYPDGLTYLKMGATRYDRLVLSADERREWMTGRQHEADLEWLRDLMLGVLPGLHVEAWSTKPCLIPDTPTKLPYLEIVDTGLVMAVGSNGYAAKSADAIGALVAGLVCDGEWTDSDLDPQSFTLIRRT